MEVQPKLLEGRLGRNPDPVLRLVVAYENFPTGQRALRACGFLLEKFRADFQFRTDWWQFEALRAPRLRTMAVHDATEAQLVLVAARADRHLPGEVMEWTEAWLERKCAEPAALVALLDGADDATKTRSLPYAYLQDAARRGNMEFFSRGLGTPTPDFFAETLAARAGIASSTLEEILHQRDVMPQWGINE